MTSRPRKESRISASQPFCDARRAPKNAETLRLRPFYYLGKRGWRFKKRDPQDYPQDYLFVSLLRNRGCGTCDSEITTGRAIGRSRYYLIISGIICQLKIVTGATHVRSNNSLRITLRTIGRHELVYAGEVRRPQGFRRKTSPSKGGLSSATTFFPRPDRF